MYKTEGLLCVCICKYTHMSETKTVGQKTYHGTRTSRRSPFAGSLRITYANSPIVTQLDDAVYKGNNAYSSRGYTTHTFANGTVLRHFGTARYFVKHNCVELLLHKDNDQFDVVHADGQTVGMKCCERCVNADGDDDRRHYLLCEHGMRVDLYNTSAVLYIDADWTCLCSARGYGRTPPQL